MAIYTPDQIMQMANQGLITPGWTGGGDIANYATGQLRPKDDIKYTSPTGQVFQYKTDQPSALGWQGWQTGGYFEQVAGPEMGGGSALSANQQAVTQSQNQVRNPQINYGKGNVPFGTPQSTVGAGMAMQQTPQSAPQPQAQAPKANAAPAPVAQPPSISTSDAQAKVDDLNKQFSGIAKQLQNLSPEQLQSGGQVMKTANDIVQAQNAIPDAGTGIVPDPGNYDPNSQTYQGSVAAQNIKNQLDQKEADWINFQNSEVSKAAAYANYAASTAGPTGQSYNDLSMQLIKANDLLRSSEDEIRSEYPGASEAQIQGLVAQRNKVLTVQAQHISDLLGLQTQYVNSMMQYLGEDQTTAENRFKTAIDITQQQLDYQQKLDDTGFSHTIQYQNQLDRQATNSFNYLKQLSATPNATISTDQANYISGILNQAGYPSTPQDVINFANDKSQVAVIAAEKQLAEAQTAALREGNVSPTTGATYSTRLNEEINNLYAGKYGTDGAREQAISILKNEFPNNPNIAANIYNRVPDKFPIKKMTATNIDSETDNAITTDIQNGFSLQAIQSNYGFVSPSYIQSKYNEYHFNIGIQTPTQ